MNKFFQSLILGIGTTGAILCFIFFILVACSLILSADIFYGVGLLLIILGLVVLFTYTSYINN